MRQEQRNFLVQVLGEERTAEIERGLTQLRKDLEESGIDWKDVGGALSFARDVQVSEGLPAAGLDQLTTRLTSIIEATMANYQLTPVEKATLIDATIADFDDGLRVLGLADGGEKEVNTFIAPYVEQLSKGRRARRRTAPRRVIHKDSDGKKEQPHPVIAYAEQLTTLGVVQG